MVDQLLLNDTLQKINASLNKRFEKDADLYISKQDEYEIKRNLCNEAYGGIVDMAKAKGISHEIVVKVIMRNAGVLNVRDVGKFKRELRPVLKDADYKALTYMMEDILGNNVYMQEEIRHILFSYYMLGISSAARIQYWRDDAFELDSFERAKLFNIIIEKTKHKDPSKTLGFKLELIQDAFKDYPSLMEEDVFVRLKATLDDYEQKEFFQYLCGEMAEPSMDNEAYNFVVLDAYVSYGEKAFNDAVSNIKASSPHNFKQYIRAIRKFFWEEKDKDTLCRMFDTICRVAESPGIKGHVRREIDKKVWKAAKSNTILYELRKTKIEQFLAPLEQTDRMKFSSFSDVAAELADSNKPKNVAYFWINMRSPDFEQSILESFTRFNPDDLLAVREAYSWLFEHSMRKGKKGELAKICERLASPLRDFRSSHKSSDFYNLLDGLWVDNVVKYKLWGENIKNYMFEAHFNRVKDWE